ncbi:MAG TPA: DUF2269 family protein [Roseiflexaceae bacterium]|nr:DUF2269 family protein [Roseiflexaceae bacterium]
MLVMRLLHILSAFWLIAGLLGRWLAFAQARRAADIHSTAALMRLSEGFERLMVIPGSQLVLALGLLAAWLGGHPLLGVLQGARANWLLVSLALSLCMIPIIALLLAPRRKLRRAALEDAVARGIFTAELRATLDDRVVLGSRATEMMITGAILVLMVLKPF